MRIVNPQEPAIINKELANKVDALRKELNVLRGQVKDVQGASLLAKDHLQHATTVNNIIFTWTGASSTLSWTNGFINEPRTNLNYPVLAGSSVLTPSTFYWAVFNHAQRIMSFTADLKKALAIIHNIPLCLLFTGTVGQSGVAGGGGSVAGNDLSGARYKNF